MIRRLYFAHPMNAYGTEVQRLCLSELEYTYRGAYTIVNPDSLEHNAKCDALHSEGADVMSYFTNVVVPSCHALAFLAFSDGRISSGAALEIERAYALGLLVYEVRVAADRRPVITIPTRYSTVVTRPLNRKETEARIRRADRSRIPWVW